MATAHIATAPSPSSGVLPVSSCRVYAVQTMTTTGTSQQSTVLGTTAQGGIWSITATGGNMYVLFGTNPTAASGSGFLIIDGTTREFEVDVSLPKVAVKDA